MEPLLYIAGMGTITPLGFDLPNTLAAVNANISAYAHTEYFTLGRKPVVMARVPDAAFKSIPCEMDPSENINCWQNRLIRMAIAALRECVSKQVDRVTVPLIIAMPENLHTKDDLPHLIPVLSHNVAPWIQQPLVRRISTGRAAGIETINFAFNYLLLQPYDYFLVMGVDSFDADEVLIKYPERLLSPGAMNAFAPGEAASALLLTRHRHLAQQKAGCVIALHPPGIAEEEGHLHRKQAYRGDGLSQAFRVALHNQPPRAIQRIYSSMNGENYWAKEYGVACLRNQDKLSAHVKVEHPADCYGDLGAATGATLVALAAEHLLNRHNEDKSLVYCSSDKSIRGAVVIEKLKILNSETISHG